jgi:hypothetical protein
LVEAAARRFGGSALGPLDELDAAWLSPVDLQVKACGVTFATPRWSA